MIYLVYGPSKSGTTSLYKALTDNSMFPCMQGHGEFSQVGIHDSLEDSGFTSRIKREFPGMVKETKEREKGIEYSNKDFKSYVLHFPSKIDIVRFFEILRRFSIKIVSPFRDPYDRSISAMVHWLDQRSIESLYMNKTKKKLDLTNITDEDISMLEHGPIEKFLTAIKQNGELSLNDVSQIYKETFQDDLLREYICVYYNLRTHFGFNVCLNDRLFYKTSKEKNDWHFFTYRLENLSQVMDAVYDYLGLPNEYVFPHSRDKTKREEYIIKNPLEDVVKQLKDQKHALSYPSIVFSF